MITSHQFISIAKTALLFTFLFVGQHSHAQNANHFIDGEKCSKYFEERVNSINIKLWEGLEAGKFQAYANDSLASTMSFEEVKERCAHKVWEQVQLSEDPYDIMDTLIEEPFNPLEEFTGMYLRFNREPLKDGIGLSYRLASISPIYEMSVSGIDLGNQPIFSVDLKDLEAVIGKEDYQFIEAVSQQRAMLGDFSMMYIDIESGELTEIGSNLAFDEISKGPITLVLYQRTFDILGYYNWSLFSALARKREEMGESLFKDSMLTQPYTNTTRELRQEFTIEIPDPEEADNPYSLIDTMILVSFEITGPYPTKIYVDDSDTIVQLIPFENETDKTINYSLETVYPYIGPQNQLIFKELINWIVTKE